MRLQAQLAAYEASQNLPPDATLSVKELQDAVAEIENEDRWTRKQYAVFQKTNTYPTDKQVNTASFNMSRGTLYVRHLNGTNGKATGAPTRPKASIMKFNTQFYERYDVAHPSNGVSYDLKFTHRWEVFNNYVLFTKEDFRALGNDVGKIPTQGVRLDDFVVAKVVMATTMKERQTNWAAEFDAFGKIRRSRCPLGHPALIYVKEGDLDVDGKVAAKEDIGWYWAFYRGIHCLMGEEGADADRFLVLGSTTEKDPADGRAFGWAKGYRALTQPTSGPGECLIVPYRASVLAADSDIEADEFGSVKLSRKQQTLNSKKAKASKEQSAKGESTEEEEGGEGSEEEELPEAEAAVEADAEAGEEGGDWEDDWISDAGEQVPGGESSKSA